MAFPCTWRNFWTLLVDLEDFFFLDNAALVVTTSGSHGDMLYQSSIDNTVAQKLVDFEDTVKTGLLH